jgi:hypothetical protein
MRILKRIVGPFLFVFLLLLFLTPVSLRAYALSCTTGGSGIGLQCSACPTSILGCAVTSTTACNGLQKLECAFGPCCAGYSTPVCAWTCPATVCQGCTYRSGGYCSIAYMCNYGSSVTNSKLCGGSCGTTPTPAPVRIPPCQSPNSCSYSTCIYGAAAGSCSSMYMQCCKPR